MSMPEGDSSQFKDPALLTTGKGEGAPYNPSSKYTILYPSPSGGLVFPITNNSKHHSCLHNKWNMCALPPLASEPEAEAPSP